MLAVAHNKNACGPRGKKSTLGLELNAEWKAEPFGVDGSQGLFIIGVATCSLSRI